MAMRVDRRTVLKGLLGGALVTVALPTLDMFLDDNGLLYADTGDGLPRRFGLFFWGNGNLPKRWVPKVTGKDYALSDQLAPLAKVKSDITVVTGTNLGVINNAPHFAGAAGLLSGAPILIKGGDETFALPSIDQVIAAKLGELTRFRSLEFGAEARDGLSYNGPNSRNPPEKSPIKLFERIFGGSLTLPGDDPVVDPTLALRRSVLDAVMGDIKSLKQRVGQADKTRLDQHFEGIRSLEKRLAKMEEDPPNLAACALPNKPKADYPKVKGRPQIHEKNQAFCDIIAMALACDQTRVFSNFLSYPVSNTLFPNASAGHHRLTHDEPGEQPEVHAITLECIKALAYQIEALRKVKEGDGTLLDHMVLLGASEVSLGKTHSLEEMPIVLAGSCSGKLKTGIHFRPTSSDNTSKVMLSICRAVGLNQASFGAEGGKVSDGLTGIEV